MFGGPLRSPFTVTAWTNGMVSFSLSKDRLWAMGNQNLWEALKAVAWPTQVWLQRRMQELKQKLAGESLHTVAAGWCMVVRGGA